MMKVFVSLSLLLAASVALVDAGVFKTKLSKMPYAKERTLASIISQVSNTVSITSSSPFLYTRMHLATCVCKALTPAWYQSSGMLVRRQVTMCR